MHGMYNYVPKTNHVSTVYSAAAVLQLQYRVIHDLWTLLQEVIS